MTQKRIFTYGQAELDHLRKRDKKMGAAIERIGLIEREVTSDLFTALVASIVSQQISAKAADTVFGRLTDFLGEITPQRVADAGAVGIQKCGVSMRKATYIHETALSVLRGEVDLAQFERYRKRYSPYGSVASLYLWEISHES